MGSRSTVWLSSTRILLQSYQLYVHAHSNKLIEEFMLLANMSVAKKIEEAFPELAILRCHPPPKLPVMKQQLMRLKRMGATNHLVSDTQSSSISPSILQDIP